MIRSALLFLFLVGSLTPLIRAQGPACTQYNVWGIGGFAGFGPDPDYSSAYPTIAAFEAQYGGAGPICTTSWYTEAPPGNWIFTCRSTAWSCKPQSPPVGGPSCPDCGEPISVANGNISIQETDVRVPGLGGGLTLTRTYNSTWPCFYICIPQSGAFGTGWRSTYEESLGASLGAVDGYVEYNRADGSIWAFASYGNPPVFHLIAPTNVPSVTLTVQASPPSWTITFENGEQRAFNGLFGGPLSAIVDRNGNTTTLTYTNVGSDSFPRYVLTTVTDPAGRHLNFSYAGGFCCQVSNVTSDPGTGINITYAYEMHYLGDLYTGPVLTKVTQSDNTSLSFAYDGFFNVTSVTDTYGKALESHLDGLLGCNVGLSSSRANGADALTLSFPNMYSYCSPGGVGYPAGGQ